MQDGVLVRYLMTLIDVMRVDYKVEAAALWLEAGLTPFDQTGTTDRVSTDYADKLWLAAAKLADDSLGLRVGATVRYTSYASLGHLLVTCETVGDTLRVIAENAHYVGAGHFSISEQGQELHLEYHLEARHPVRQQRAVASLLPFSTLAKSMVGGILPNRLTLQMAKPENHELYNRYFDIPISYGMGANSVVWDKAVLDQRMPDANAALNELLLRHVKNELNEQHTMSAKVEKIILGILDAEETEAFASLNLNYCAELLEMSRRSLQRALMLEDRKFRDLLNGIRVAKAEHLLLNTALPVAKISEKLGYSEAAAFVRAFRTRKEISPSRYRADCQNNADR